MCRWSTPLDFHFDALHNKNHETWVVCTKSTSPLIRRVEEDWRWPIDDEGDDWKFFSFFPLGLRAQLRVAEIFRRVASTSFSMSLQIFLFLLLLVLKVSRKKSSKSNALENSLINGARFLLVPTLCEAHLNNWIVNLRWTERWSNLFSALHLIFRKIHLVSHPRIDLFMPLKVRQKNLNCPELINFLEKNSKSST